MIKKIRGKVWKTLRPALRRNGIDAFLHLPNHHYVPDFYGCSAKDREDIRDSPIFGEVARETIAQKRAFLYYDRLYVIFQVLQNLQRQRVLAEGALGTAEVGVYRGGTSRFIAAAAAALGLDIAHYAFDTFEGHDAVDIKSGVDTQHVAQKFSDTDYEAVRDYLSEYSNVSVYKGRIQDQCSAVENQMFGFVHLDTDLYEPTIFGLNFFDQRFLPGSTFVVDDYGTKGCPGIKQSVGEFLATHPNYAAYHPLTEQCVLIKTAKEQHRETFI